jgi:hypothetical protein
MFLRFRISGNDPWRELGPAVVVALILSAVIARQYYRTKDTGFIWLWVALVVWPLNYLILSFFYGASINGRHLVPGVHLPEFPTSEETATFYFWAFNILRFLGCIIIALAINSLYKDPQSRPLDDASDDKRAVTR